MNLNLFKEPDLRAMDDNELKSYAQQTFRNEALASKTAIASTFSIIPVFLALTFIGLAELIAVVAPITLALISIASMCYCEFKKIAPMKRLKNRGFEWEVNTGFQALLHPEIKFKPTAKELEEAKRNAAAAAEAAILLAEIQAKKDFDAAVQKQVVLQQPVRIPRPLNFNKKPSLPGGQP